MKHVPENDPRSRQRPQRRRAETLRGAHAGNRTPATRPLADHQESGATRPLGKPRSANRARPSSADETRPLDSAGAPSGRPTSSTGNKLQDRLRAQQAVDDPRIPAGLTPTGTGGNPNAEPHVRDVYPRSMGEFLKAAWKDIVLVVAVIVAIVVLLFAVRAVTSGTASQNTADQEGGYVSPYTWSNLARTNGRYSYMVNGKSQSQLGIDVSEVQGAIDWDAVAQDGIDFAYIRVGYRGTTAGDLYEDEYFSYNLSGAKAAGLDVGVYFFSQATTVEEAREEADFVVQALDGESLVYPIAFDSEENAGGIGTPRTAGLSKDEMTAIAEAFCDEVEAAGYRSIVYGNASDLSRYNVSTLENHGIWLAEYGVPNPTAQIDFYMWQYSNSGSVAGIDTEVDMDLDLTEAYQNSPNR